MKILVVGGAGYIGSHTCLDLHAKGFTPVVFDNLENGHEEFVRWGPFERGDILDTDRVHEVIARYQPEAIVHFAALIEVGQSVQAPLAFYRNNVAGTISLLSAARRAGVRRMVFSSTCATYGLPQHLPLTEGHPQRPLSPYGRTKLMVEDILRDMSGADDFRSVSLRYFNAAGADPEGRIGEWHEPETHAIPLALEVALGRRRDFKIFGDDYDTRDGTCVRDYVHVMDLADAHSRAVQYLLDDGASISINLGTGTGTTVKELLDKIEAVTRRKLNVVEAARRPGDAPVLVADNELAREVLGWSPRYDLSEIVGTAWNWHSRSNM
ncbi:MAG: UDP-glucose 4-epimerase GalE [Fulvimarina sp.]|nr:UDP-glucose 4-epimerase GalE [Fulvimarina sp.]